MTSLEDAERFDAVRFSRLEHWIDALRPYTFEVRACVCDCVRVMGIE